MQRVAEDCLDMGPQGKHNPAEEYGRQNQDFQNSILYDMSCDTLYVNQCNII